MTTGTIEQFPTTSNIKHYFGLFIGYAVQILEYDEGVDLYKHGCFGKGNLSRSTLFFDKLLNNNSNSNEFTAFHSKKNIKKRPKDNTSIPTTTDTPTKSTTSTTKVKLTNERLKIPKVNDTTQIKPEYIDISNIKEIKENNNSNSTIEDINEPIEYLQLSLSEAFFLCYSLGCLTVLREPNIDELKDDNNNICTNNSEKEEKTTLYRMSIQECWYEFVKSEYNFVENFIVYSYFRSIGWIPRSGLKYGCDLVLYKLKPDLIHAQYGVVVQKYYTNENNNEDDNKYTLMKNSRKLSTWEEIVALNRVSESVAKGIIICNVISPFSSSCEDSYKIENLPRYIINSFSLNRWVPNRTRQ
ncbi:hypothetical protein DLAC_11329 [Tieghemostelium lacteum]|uniref:tRNA-splicing endonuclease subunit Sen2 n=1 Tax=Tieghemostelium lacteum TaxID=361077 RepID=A0A151Z3R9_TIELA|nr:hypothetical protein DLAC_11329 [Tieghemostelium lacteum]|eukprot:KYQ88591.1 hypothetical protein DLAC_11329 [Tieghemostelium lacteum]